MSLTWAGINLNRRSVTVFRSKNGERRTIPANQTVLGLLGKKYAIRQTASDLVFHSQIGTRLDGSNIRRCLNSALKTPRYTISIFMIFGTRSRRAWSRQE